MDLIIDSPEIKNEYIRWKQYFEKKKHYSEKNTVTIFDVLKAHFLVGDYFYKKGDGISDVGPRDPNLLYSAVYRQFVSFAGRDKWTSPYEKCATLIFGINHDHVFHDANKRTSLLILLNFLHKKNRYLTIKPRKIDNFIIDVAKNTIKEKRKRKDKQTISDDPEIRYIAKFILKKSRIKTHTRHTVTFQELDKILKRFNYCFDNPQGNHINICKIEEKKYFFRKKTETKLKKVFQVNFPGWKTQAGKGTISHIRKSTGLVPEKGIDSESFYRGAEPLYSLISEYQGPLERLSHK